MGAKAEEREGEKLEEASGGCADCGGDAEDAGAGAREVRAGLAVASVQEVVLGAAPANADERLCERMVSEVGGVCWLLATEDEDLPVEPAEISAECI